jgi:hypothetical protein
MAEKIIFLTISLLLIGILLWMTYRKEKTIFGVLFIFSLGISVAFYLFQYGELSSFSLSSKLADLEFIREKKKEIHQDAEEITKIKKQLQDILNDSQQSQKTITEAQKRIISLEKELQQTTEMAKPASLTLYSKEIKKISNQYEALLYFEPSKNSYIGIINFAVKILNNSDSNIIKFWPEGSFSYGKDSIKISNDGKEATLDYAITEVSYPAVRLTISQPASVLVSGSHLLNTLTIEIK